MDRRRERRRKVLKEGKVMLTESVWVDCVIRDLSPSGARIEFDKPLYLPSQFRLHIVSADLTIPVVPVWRSRCEAGVRFTGVGSVGAIDNTLARTAPTAA